MFERYSERSRRIIFFARYEALQYGSPVISPEHILLGLLREDKAAASRYFAAKGNVNTERVRAEIEDRIVVRDRIPQSAELHLSPEAKRVLFYANEESRAGNSRFVSPEHILIGLLREGDAAATGLLDQMGIGVKQVRAALGTYLNEEQG